MTHALREELTHLTGKEQNWSNFLGNRVASEALPTPFNDAVYLSDMNHNPQRLHYISPQIIFQKT